ncbi:MAG: ACGX-repeat peptide [Clostridia bacterium]|nr:ACGX-repeat peptide [Clostridia bacterium]
MALKNLFGADVAQSTCGSACGTKDKQPTSACGSACGAKEDEPKPSACGAPDKQ